METPPLPPSIPRKKPQPIYAFETTVIVALILATLFTMLPSSGLASGKFLERLRYLFTPQPQQNSATVPQAQLRIGIVAGHSGNDSGAVCLDANGNAALTEADINMKIAALVQKQLTDQGFQVDLLKEFDTRLNGYRAVAIVSIHNDSCEYINDQATGFKVAAALNTRDINRANRLTACLVDRYHSVTGLAFHAGSITGDMREYHAFREIDPSTIAAIVETGFLNLDREILTTQTDKIANGVTQGILCFVHNENIVPTPIPTFGP